MHTVSARQTVRREHVSTSAVAGHSHNEDGRNNTRQKDVTWVALVLEVWVSCT